jgi:DNA-binding GntR family transcriptional regulator
MPASTASVQNRSDGALRRLRGEIIAGALLPGALLAEAAVARRLGLSRVPVREALFSLEREGLVEFSATGRAFVKCLTERDFEEIVATRVALEGMASDVAARHWREADSAYIHRNIAEQECATTLAELSRLDVAMHAYIVERSGNSRLLALWRCIRPQFELWLAHTHRLQARLDHEPRQVTVDSHRLLLRALESRDPQRAAAAMAQHITSWREWLPAHFPPRTAQEQAVSQIAAAVGA